MNGANSPAKVVVLLVVCHGSKLKSDLNINSTTNLTHYLATVGNCFNTSSHNSRVNIIEKALELFNAVDKNNYVLTFQNQIDNLKQHFISSFSPKRLTSLIDRHQHIDKSILPRIWNPKERDEINKLDKETKQDYDRALILKDAIINNNSKLFQIVNDNNNDYKNKSFTCINEDTQTGPRGVYVIFDSQFDNIKQNLSHLEIKKSCSKGEYKKITTTGNMDGTIEITTQQIYDLYNGYDQIILLDISCDGDGDGLSKKEKEKIKILYQRELERGKKNEEKNKMAAENEKDREMKKSAGEKKKLKQKIEESSKVNLLNDVFNILPTPPVKKDENDDNSYMAKILLQQQKIKEMAEDNTKVNTGHASAPPPPKEPYPYKKYVREVGVGHNFAPPPPPKGSFNDSKKNSQSRGRDGDRYRDKNNKKRSLSQNHQGDQYERQSQQWDMNKNQYNNYSEGRNANTNRQNRGISHQGYNYRTDQSRDRDGDRDRYGYYDNNFKKSKKYGGTKKKKRKSTKKNKKRKSKTRKNKKK